MIVLLRENNALLTIAVLPFRASNRAAGWTAADATVVSVEHYVIVMEPCSLDTSCI